MFCRPNGYNPKRAAQRVHWCLPVLMMAELQGDDMAFAYFDEAFNIRLAQTRQQAERLNNGSAVAEVNELDHWCGPLSEAIFTPEDQSYHQLLAAMAAAE